MARIRFENLRHSYLPRPRVEADADWALKSVDLDWRDGGAYALLGPSGCGKTSLLNIVSGLIAPTTGRVFFDDTDVTHAGPAERRIAQVFQFPVVYDTMTVRQNLAFPLRNRGLRGPEADARVAEVAELLDLTDTLDQRASGLTADGKQKISLGRGLVRSDVNAILFDEPLTVIDPHLKWRLRSKLKELHQRIAVTMIYVTHDQTEALTFADTVVVMHEGRVVQVGTPVELFEKPRHSFVGHFIGSPGMNFLPCALDGGAPVVAGRRIATADPAAKPPAGAALEIGVRPEHVTLASGDDGLPAQVVKVVDAGRFRVIETRVGDRPVRLLLDADVPAPSGETRLAFRSDRTRLYADGWLVEGGAA